MMEVLVATPKAVRIWGGVGDGRVKYPHQASHDLLVAQVHLRLAVDNPAAAAAWIPEDQLASERRRGTRPGEKVATVEKIPDGVLRDSTGRITKAIEVGGRYSRRVLEQLHAFCERERACYELW